MSAALIAALLKIGFTSAMGIVCGWQPMPDGSAAYECVIQVEPELLDALKRGDSIPLSVDIPEHVRPISRVRLTVGDGNVPQQVLAEVPKKSLDGVVQTQFTTSHNNAPGQYAHGYGGQVVPVNDQITNVQDAFARSLQNGGQAVRNAVTEMTQDILPPDPVRGMASAAQRAGEQLGTNLRSAGETVREDIRQLFGDGSTAGNSEILPPRSQAAETPNNQPEQILPESSSMPANRRRLDQPINDTQLGDWQSRSVTPAPQSTPVASSNRYDSVFTTNPNSAILPQNQASQPQGQASPFGDRYASATPHADLGQHADDNRSGDSPASTGIAAGTGPAFPSFTPTGNQPITPTPQTPSEVAEIRRDMLSRPADAAIQGSNGLPVSQQQASQPAAAPASASAADFGWATTPQPTIQTTAGPSPSGPVLPLVLSWVLLSGSGAGNLYLFWSYLDVRNKYHDLVDDASRRISGRRVRD